MIFHPTPKHLHKFLRFTPSSLIIRTTTTTATATAIAMPGRAHGRGGKDDGRAHRTGDREMKISKAMSFVLRHGAVKEGLAVDQRGFVNVQDLLSWHRLASLNVTFPELQSVVETNAKQRFTLIPAPELATDLELATDSDHTPTHDPLNPAHHLIRATQGHSLPIASENLLTPILATDPDCPDLVVHGTFHSKWKLIRESGGLRPMGRQHVHFALGLPSEGAALFRPGANTITSASTTEVEEKQKGNGDSSEQIANPTSTADDPTLAPVPTLPSATQAPTSAKQSLSSQPVISGMRATATVLIWVDLKRSLEAGALKWWRSANGVVLTEGDAKGKVGLEWVNRVEMRGGKESALVGMR